MMRGKGNGAALTVLALVAAVFLAVSPAGCAKKDGGAKKVVVGIVNSYPPFAYLDEEGKLQGYDYQVLLAVDRLLEDVEFEFQPVQWATLITSLREGYYDLVTSQLERNPEREAQFLFNEENFFDFAAYLIVPADNSSITGIESMKGKRLGTVIGTNQAAFIQHYLETNPGVLEPVYYTSTNTFQDIYINLSSGAWDASLSTKFDMERTMQAYPGIRLKVARTADGTETPPVTNEPTYFLFGKSQGDLAAAIDGALRTLKADGTLNELQMKELGQVYMDFTR